MRRDGHGLGDATGNIAVWEIYVDLADRDAVSELRKSEVSTEI